MLAAANGDPSNSKLIDGVWRKLAPEQEYGDPHIKAVAAVAYYQPLKAIEFAEQLIRDGKFLNQIPEILRFAAFHLDHVKRACEALWEIGKGDSRPLTQHGHAVGRKRALRPPPTIHALAAPARDDQV